MPTQGQGFFFKNAAGKTVFAGGGSGQGQQSSLFTPPATPIPAEALGEPAAAAKVPHKAFVQPPPAAAQPRRRSPLMGLGYNSGPAYEANLKKSAEELASRVGGQGGTTQSPPALSPEADYQQNGTKAKAFKAWFGDWEHDPANASKVVNPETGEPEETHGVKEVYHGTENEFTAFDKDKIGSNGSAVGRGFYFSEKPEIAQNFAQSSKGRVVKAHLNIRVPFDFDSQMSAANVRSINNVLRSMPRDEHQQYDEPEIVGRQLEVRHGDGTPLYKSEAWKLLKQGIGKKNVNSVLQKAGWDGITHQSRDPSGSPSSPRDSEVMPERLKKYGRVWIAFEPTQIKSTQNRGHFDPANPDIRMSRFVTDDQGRRVFRMARDPEGSGGGGFFFKRGGKTIHAGGASGGQGKGEPAPLAAGPAALGLNPRKRTGLVRPVADEAQSARGLGKLTLDTDESGKIDPNLVDAYRRHLATTGHTLGEFAVNPRTRLATAAVTHGNGSPGAGGTPGPDAKTPFKAFVQPQSFMPGLNAAKVAIEGRIGVLKDKLAQTKGGGSSPQTLESLDAGTTPARETWDERSARVKAEGERAHALYRENLAQQAKRPMGTQPRGKGNDSGGIFRKLPDGRTIFIPGHRVRSSDKPVSPVTASTPASSAPPPEAPLVEAAKAAKAERKTKLESMADAAIAHAQAHPNIEDPSGVAAAVAAQAAAHGEDVQHTPVAAAEPVKAAVQPKAPTPAAPAKPAASKPEPTLKEFKAKVKADAKARESAKAVEQGESKKEPQREGLQSIRQQIHDYYRESGGGLPPHIQQELENMRSAFVVYKGSPRASEFKEMQKEGGVIDAKGGIRWTDNPREAGAEDAIGELTDKYGHHGEEYYRQAFRERAGTGFHDAMEHTRKAAASGDERAQWLVRLHDEYTPGKKDVTPAENLKLDDHAILHGDPIKVTLDADGEKIVEDGGKFPAIPLRDLQGVKLPLDKGSLHHQEPELPAEKATAPAEPSISHDSLIAEHKRLSSEADQVRSRAGDMSDARTFAGGGGASERRSQTGPDREQLGKIFARQREIESVVGLEAVYGKQFQPLGQSKPAPIAAPVPARESFGVTTARNQLKRAEAGGDPMKVTAARAKLAALQKGGTIGEALSAASEAANPARTPANPTSPPVPSGANAAEQPDETLEGRKRHEHAAALRRAVAKMGERTGPRPPTRGEVFAAGSKSKAREMQATRSMEQRQQRTRELLRNHPGMPYRQAWERSLTMSRDAGQGYFFTNEHGKRVFASGKAQGGLFDAPEAVIPTAAVSEPTAPAPKPSLGTGRSHKGFPIHFAEPIAGPSGAKITHYEWQWRPEQEVNDRGDEIIRKVSDWDSSATNEHTGREIVHHFGVTDLHGAAHVVSLETAASMLGFGGSAKMPAESKSKISTVKTLAKQHVELAKAKAEHEALERKADEVRTHGARLMGQAPPLEVTYNRDRDSTIFGVGDARVSGFGHLHSMPGSENYQERASFAKQQWRDNRLFEMGHNPRAAEMASYAKARVADIQKRIDRSHAKLGIKPTVAMSRTAQGQGFFFRNAQGKTVFASAHSQSGLFGGQPAIPAASLADAPKPSVTESLPFLRGAPHEVAQAMDRRAAVLPKMEAWVTSLENSNHPKAKVLRGQLDMLKRSREARHWLQPAGPDAPAYDPHGIGAAQREDRARYGIPFSRDGGQGYFFTNQHGQRVFASGQKQTGLFEAPAAAIPTEAVKPEQSLHDFAAHVQRLGDEHPVGLGDNKVYLSHIAAKSGMEPEAFKAKVKEAAHHGLLHVSRADLPLDPKEEARSEVNLDPGSAAHAGGGNATAHYLLVKSKERTPIAALAPKAAPAPAPKAENVKALKPGRGGTPASEIEKLRPGERVTVNGETHTVHNVTMRNTAETIPHPTDPGSTLEGQRRVRTASLTLLSSGGQTTHPHTFYETLSEHRPWEGAAKPPVDNSRQLGLHGQGEIGERPGQTSMFGEQKAVAPVAAPKPERIGSANAADPRHTAPLPFGEKVAESRDAQLDRFYKNLSRRKFNETAKSSRRGDTYIVNVPHTVGFGGAKTVVVRGAESHDAAKDAAYKSLTGKGDKPKAEKPARPPASDRPLGELPLEDFRKHVAVYPHRWGDSSGGKFRALMPDGTDHPGEGATEDEVVRNLHSRYIKYAKHEKSQAQERAPKTQMSRTQGQGYFFTNAHGQRVFAAGGQGQQGGLFGGGAAVPVEAVKAEPKAAPVAEPVRPSVAVPRGETSAPTPKAARKLPPTGDIQDFGEKIGGARKDTATPLGPRAPKPIGPADERPGWHKRWMAMQQVQGVNKTGKWTVQRFTDDKRRMAIASMYNRGQTYDTREAAEAAIPMHEVSRNHRVTNAARHGEPANYAIVRDITDRKRAIVKGGFPTEQAAKEHMAAHPVEIIEHKFPFPDEVEHLTHIQREGPTHRTGDVKPEDFQKAFGFRGGEFGNWNMGREGQEALNHAYDSLHDLAHATGLHPKALSIGGELGIAFGARGTGGKGAGVAHYEPDKTVINLTKIKGAGSLAHEWYHALDNHLAKMAGGKSEDFASAGLPYKHTMRPELASAVKNLTDTMMTKNVVKPIESTFESKRSEHAKNAVAERITEIERRMSDDARYNQKRHKPFTPEQQAEWNTHKAKLIAGDVGEKKIIGGDKPVRSGRNPFSFRQTFEPMERMNQLYKGATGRAFHTADQSSQGHGLYWAVSNQADAGKRVAAAQQGMTETKKSRTDFYDQARQIDNYHTGDYYSEPHEMAARAFANYVHGKLEGEGRRSDYIASRGRSVNTPRNSRLGKPYPEGEERTAIHGAFDNLFKTLKVEEGTNARGKPAHLVMSRAPRFARDPATGRLRFVTAA